MYTITIHAPLINFLISQEPGIYMLTNVKNGKKYVGETSNLRKRMKNHFTSFLLNEANKEMQADYDKGCYFICEVLETMPNSTKKERVKVEEKYTLQHQSHMPEFGYNYRLGMKHTERFNNYGKKNGMFGKKHSEETIEKIRQQKMGNGNPATKINTKNLQEIVDKINSGLSDEVLAKEYNVMEITINNIRNERTWKKRITGLIKPEYKY